MTEIVVRIEIAEQGEYRLSHTEKQDLLEEYESLKRRTEVPEQSAIH